jgi:hypothetical protein
VIRQSKRLHRYLNSSLEKSVRRSKGPLNGTGLVQLLQAGVVNFVTDVFEQFGTAYIRSAQSAGTWPPLPTQPPLMSSISSDATGASHERIRRQVLRCP